MSGGASSASALGTDRLPTLSFPVLHLGSFNNLTPDSFPSPQTSPTQRHFPSRLADETLGPSAGLDVVGLGSGQGLGQGLAQGQGSRPSSPLRQASGRLGSPHSNSHPASFLPRSDSKDVSRSPARQKGTVPPPLLPPQSMSLPPLPSISPISPLAPPSPSDFHDSSAGQKGALPSRGPVAGAGSSGNLPSSVTGPAGPRELPPARGRPLGPSLTIRIPGNPSPSSAPDRQSAILKDSPGIPQRRTIIEQNPVVSRVSPVRMSQVIDSLSPPQDGSSKIAAHKASFNKLTMPVATPTGVSASRVEDDLRRGEESAAVEASPGSPTPKRCLPRTPKSESPAPISDARPSASLIQQSIPLPASGPSQPPTSLAVQPSSRPRTSRTPEEKPSLQPTTPRHQPTNSASTLPVIGGLADAGPYPSTSPNANRASGPSNVGLGRPPAKQPPPEEVCLECMMRDRDLADVTVQGQGVWDRESDVAWEEFRWREESLLKSIGSINGSVSVSGSAPSKMSSHSLDSSSDESASFSRSSFGGNSAEDAEAKRRMMARRRKKEMVRAKRRETDQRVLREVGWRGFKWEEGSAGEGLPRGFRGTKGEPLTEEGIKAVMIKFPSASALRYSNLQTYLKHQYHLVLEIAAEAKRIGHFPMPYELSIRDEPPVAAGSRTTSLTWDQTTRDVPEHTYGVSTPTTTLGFSLVGPRPASPGELNQVARGKLPPLQRPLTHFIPDREPAPIPSPNRSGSGLYDIPRARHGKGISSPGMLQSSPKLDEVFDAEEDLWSPISPADSGMRPFSFAVRAGAAAAREGSEGHGRKSLFGRWGGSVTSFFGGSQGGSGSMIDMHLGLDNERRHHTSSINVHAHPRAVSLASPTRPSFFARDSRPSSADTEREARMAKSISNSRLSQAMSAEDEPKKKGFKGLFKKMKPKSRKGSKSSIPVPRHEEDSIDLGAPLAPPPPLSFLVGRGDRQHNRNRSGSSSSMLTDSQASIAPKRESAGYGGIRSVSVPLAGSSSGGSQSVSPTSSRFNGNARRESYASLNGKRQSGTLVDEESGYPGQRGSLVEVLSGRQVDISPETTHLLHNSDDPRDHLPGQGHVATYPPPPFRPHNKTTSSLSASSGMLETPPPHPHNAFFTNHPSGTIVKSPSPNLSPNRFKNLPPLPPTGSSPGDNHMHPHQLSRSPEIPGGAFAEPPDSSSKDGWPSPNGHLAPPFNHSPRGYAQPHLQSLIQGQGQPQSPRPSFDHLQTESFDHPQYRPQYQPTSTHSPRKSYDPGNKGTPRRAEVQPSPRMVKSMYAQPSAAGSIVSLGSLGRQTPWVNGGGGGEYHQYGGGESGNGYGYGGDGDTRSTKSRKGFKAWFGASKAGRLA